MSGRGKRLIVVSDEEGNSFSKIIETNDSTFLKGLPKAEYAVGYFTEMGIGCRRDPLEANVWYVKAADQGDERAKTRIAAIRAAASGGTVDISPQQKKRGKKKNGDLAKEEEEKGKTKKWGIF